MGLKTFLDKALGRPIEGDKIEYFGEVKRKCNGYVLSSATTQPAASYHYDLDVTKMWEEYQAFKSECGYSLSFNTIIVKAMIECLKIAPRLNAHIDFKPYSVSGRLIIKKHINIAMPVLLDNGETFPVNILSSEEKNLKELQEQIADIVTRMKTTDINRTYTDLTLNRGIAMMLSNQMPRAIAMTVKGAFGKSKMGKISDLFGRGPKEENALTIDHIREGTVCFSNYGSLKVDGFSAHAPLLYPQVFMMGVGKIRDEEFVFRNSNGEIDLGTRKLMPVTLTFDHRIGALNDVVPFMEKLKEIFENPEVIKEW